MDNLIYFDRELLPIVTTVGQYQVEEPWIHRERHLDINTMLIVEEGMVYISEEDINYVVPSGHVFYFKSGAKQKGTNKIPPGSKWYWVSFHLPSSHNDLQLLPKLVDISSSERIIDSVRDMESLYNGNTMYKQPLLNGKLYEIFFELLSLEEGTQRDVGVKKIAPKIIGLLHQQQEMKFSAKLIEDKMGMNYSYLGRLFKAETGMSINQYFMKLKVNQAINLLHTSHMNITQISDHLNYPNPYYFSRVFKQTMGISPKAYQSQMYR